MGSAHRYARELERKCGCQTLWPPWCSRNTSVWPAIATCVTLRRREMIAHAAGTSLDTARPDSPIAPPSRIVAWRRSIVSTGHEMIVRHALARSDAYGVA